MNDAMRHQGTYKNAWKKIEGLVGDEVPVSSASDGRVVWKIVPSESVTDDFFKDIRKQQEKALRNDGSQAALNEDMSDCLRKTEDHVAAFWKLFPSDMDADIEKINSLIHDENKIRKQKFQRVHREITKQEYIIFHALMIALQTR